MDMRLSHTCCLSEMSKLYHVACRHIRIYKEQMSQRLLALDQEKCRLLVAIDACVTAHASLVDQLFALDERLARFPSDDPWALLEYMNTNSVPLVHDVKASRRHIDDMRQRLRTLTASGLSMQMSLARYRADEAALAQHCVTVVALVRQSGGFSERRELTWRDVGTSPSNHDLQRAHYCREIDAINVLCDRYANIYYSYA